jgi:hypothetical protein
MAKRLTRKLTDVIAEVEQTLIREYGITRKEIQTWQARAKMSPHSFPTTAMVAIAELWIDYEVQRDVICKHIINIMKKWDARVCSPVSACRLVGKDRTDTYDGQHRTIAAGILGFAEVPCAVVETTDPNFASYAFEMLNDTGVRRLGPGDLHRNALVRFKNGSRDKKVVDARTMQDQFDVLSVDLEDKNTRKSTNLRGENDYFFSHFKYAQKAIELDASGNVLRNILDAIKSVFPTEEEIDQGIYIGLYELQRLKGTSPNIRLPDDWMVTLLKSVKKTFRGSHIAHEKAKRQWEHRFPGAGWSAPSAMSNFLREVHIMNGGNLDLPYHGEGAKIGIEDGDLAPGLIPELIEA